MSHDYFFFLSLLVDMGYHIQKGIIDIPLIWRYGSDFFLEMSLMRFHLPEWQSIFVSLNHCLFIIILVVFAMLCNSLLHCRFVKLKCGDPSKIRSTNQRFVIFENQRSIGIGMLAAPPFVVFLFFVEQTVHELTPGDDNTACTEIRFTHIWACHIDFSTVAI